MALPARLSSSYVQRLNDLVSHAQTSLNAILFILQFATQYGRYSTLVSTSTGDAPIEYQSFAGGQATNSDAIYDEIERTSLQNDLDAPPPLLIQAKLEITLRATYARDTTDLNRELPPSLLVSLCLRQPRRVLIPFGDARTPRLRVVPRLERLIDLCVVKAKEGVQYLADGTKNIEALRRRRNDAS